jgi:hypothetical protein
MASVEVLEPKPVDRFGGVGMESWAVHQLEVARDVLDNPGGGLVSASQAIGQVRAGLAERGGIEYQPVVVLLQRAEYHGVRREFGQARELLNQALDSLAGSDRPGKSD